MPIILRLWSNSKKALYYFEENAKNEKNDFLEIIGISVIKSFEFSFELAWNLMKDYATYQGITNVAGSRDAIREAFAMGLINEKNQMIWREMIISRNQSSHTYNQSTATDILKKIKEDYLFAFQDFEEKMKPLSQ
ncbi:HI0074 family nucleotidyltransferase substrate-binding subunit [Capnocytophaga canimorsus]|nr:HI0074 family nucleotidyltransferase substrate-binding subunit [Capnocytophaga canimorsus]WGU68745.1 HI0074 family nucleotidyltransferase substrate-binding subunit [Capnocytophaga canimorsus]WGU70152.1 HI0074 family nucleotidyltransferase substrate-binding subunit [Capnocytophaga canimorsus]